MKDMEETIVILGIKTIRSSESILTGSLY